MFRKTVLTTAIIGAGLGTMTGAAFAGDDPGDGGHSSHEGNHSSWDHGKSSSCSNDVKAENLTKSGGLADVIGGDQVLAPINVCHILDDNKLLNHNNVALLGGSIHNGDSSGSSDPLGGLPL
ncbi:hypothetical protein LQ327_03290 [Actinomycetospora endophytica]|uniref:Small secreted domain DUF320 n=1 Tax=Actinomycetospora endophytica TaxID=2291215 RepID=A0ABS8P2G4_9PSEU|nr:hypothetical protein [Actinomycetospora endophytica]MCD2192420.1 hypothetical protein [Actinomycetospora endophytica]